MSHKNGQHVTCPVCGNAFYRPQCLARRITCSIPCKNELRKGSWPLRFWAKVDKTPGCWLWLAGTNGDFGTFTVRGRSVVAHRLSWVLVNGEIPKGLQISHNCPGGNNPLCVNPAHLVLRDQRGENSHTAKLTAEKVLAIRKARAGGEMLKDIAGKHHVSIAIISRICSRKKWQHV